MDEHPFHVLYDLRMTFDRLLTQSITSLHPRIHLVELPVQNDTVHNGEDNGDGYVDGTAIRIQGEQHLYDGAGELRQLEISVDQILPLVRIKNRICLIINKITNQQASQLPIEAIVDNKPRLLRVLEEKGKEYRHDNARAKDEQADEAVEISHDGYDLIDFLPIVIIQWFIKEIGDGGAHPQLREVQECQQAIDGGGKSDELIP